MSNLDKKNYTYLFILPAAIIYFVLFLFPTLMSFFFSLTRWTLVEWEFVGLENFKTFFSEDSLNIGFKNALIYGSLTSLLKVVFGFLIALLLCSKLRTVNFLRSMVFFPHLLSTIAVGVVFSSIMHPSTGLINKSLEIIGINGPDWLGDINLALYSVITVDFWKGVGVAVILYIAGILSIPEEYFEALMIDGGNYFDRLKSIIMPLSKQSTNSVIILSLIAGLRSFDLIWVMTKGGPGFTTDVISSIIYKQYQGGFYGISTAGNVILFILVSAVAFPLYRFLSKSEVEL
jgi:raffinose/stachyose/melibiose transport system permease protein